VVTEAVYHDDVQGPVELRSPKRLRRCLSVRPELAGIGATPASLANAASLRHRPGCDHAHKTFAATIGPTPNWASRSGRHALMIAVIAVSCVLASVFKTWWRRARSRNTPRVGLGLAVPPGIDPDLAA